MQDYSFSGNRRNRRPLGATVDESIELNRPQASEPAQVEDPLGKYRDEANRQAAAVNKQSAEAHKQAKVMANTEQERRFRKAGADFFKADDGNYYQNQDEQGRALFQESDWELRETDKKTGSKREVRRNKFGEVEDRSPALKAGSNLQDSNMYYSDGSAAGHVDDIANGGDTEQSAVAKKVQASRKDARLKSVGSVFDKKIAAQESEIYGARSRRDQLALERENLDTQKQELEADENFDNTNGVWFLPKGMEDPTPEAAALQKQHAALQERVGALDTEASDIDFKLDTEGDLTRNLNTAKDDKKLWEAQTKLGDAENLEAQRMSILHDKGASPKAIEEDEILQQIRADREAYGVESSNLSAKKREQDAIAGQARAGIASQVSVESSYEDFEKVSGELESEVQAFNDASDSLAAMRTDVESGKVTADEFNAQRAALEKQAVELQAESKAFKEIADDAYKSRADERITEIESLMDEAEESPLFNANWGNSEVYSSALKRQMSRTDSKPGEVSSGVSNVAKSFVSFTGGLVSEAVNIVRGSTPEDVAKREEYASVQQLSQGFRGENLKKYLGLHDEYSSKANKTEWEGGAEDIATEGRLGKLQSLLNEMRAGDTNAAGQFSTEAIGTFASISNLVGYVPGVDYNFEMRGIDRDNPEEVAKFNVLIDGIRREQSARHETSSILGQAGGSLAQFMVTRKMGNMMASRVAPIMNKVGARVPKFDAAKMKFNLNTDKLGASLGYGAMGFSQSASENPNEMGVLNRALDGIGNAVVLAIAEGMGNKAEAALIKRVGARPTWGSFATRKTALTAAAFMGENISEIIEAGIKGEDAGENLKQILTGNLGAVVGMGLLGLKGEVKTQKQYKHFQRQHERDLGELHNRLSDLNALVNASEGHGAEEARVALELLGGKQAVEQLNEFVEKQVTEGTDKAPLNEQLAWLEDQNPKVVIVGQAAETMQKQASINMDIIGEIGERFAQRAGEEGVSARDELTRERAGALALVKLANGNTNLTVAEKQALSEVEGEVGTELIIEHNGQGVMTDGAIEWLTRRAPSAKKLITKSEAEQVAGIEEAQKRADAAEAEAAAQESDDGVSTEKEADGTNTPVGATAEDADDSAPSMSTAAMVSYVDGDGESQGAKVPAGSTTSKGEPVTEANVAEWLSEQGKTVRKVNTFKQSKPKESNETNDTKAKVTGNGDDSASETSTKTEVTGPINAGQILKRFRANAKEQLGDDAGKVDTKLAGVSRTFATRLNEAIDTYRGIFGDDKVKVVNEAQGSGGVILDGKGNLVVSIDDLFNPLNLAELRDNPERIGKIVEEEAIHAVATQVLKPAEVTALWDELTDSTKNVVEKAYGKGDSFQLGHEFLRMIVQGRIAVKNGKLEADGAAISEDLSGTGLLEKISDALAKIRDYFTDLAGTLRKDGASEQTIEAVESAVHVIETRLNQLTAADGKPAKAEEAKPAPKKAPEVSIDTSDSPLGDTGTYKLQDGTKASYHFEVVEESEVLEDPRNTKPGMESFDTRKFVEKNSGPNYDAELSFAIDPTFQQGAPMVEREGGKMVIKGGHRRTYIRRNNRKAYEAALPTYAKRFGIDPAAFAGMKSPVIVAVLDEQLTEPQRDSFITQLNESNQQGVTTAWDATKIARKMTPDLVRTAGALFNRNPDATPLEVLQSADAAEFTSALLAANVLSDQDAKKYIRENGALSNRDQGGGATIFKKVLLATVIDDPRTLDRIEGTAMETKLLNAIGPMVTLIDRGQDPKVLQQAIAAEAERLQLSPEPSVADFQSQAGLSFEDESSPESQAVHRWLASFNSPQARNEFGQLVNDFAPNEDAAQAGLFGEENQDIGAGLLARERGQAANKIEVAVLQSRFGDIEERAREIMPELSTRFNQTLNQYRQPKKEGGPKKTDEEILDGLRAKFGKEYIDGLVMGAEQHIEKHSHYESTFVDALKSVVEEAGGKYFDHVPLKGLGRAVEKVALAEQEKDLKYTKKYGNPVLGLRDVLRNTIEVETITDAYKVLNAMMNRINTADSEDRFFFEPTPVGYRDFQVIGTFGNGIFAEIQVNTVALLRAKDVGHAYYAMSRGHGTTQAQKQRAEKIQTRIYGNAWKYDIASDVVKHGKYAVGSRSFGQILASSQADISSRDAILLPGKDSKIVQGKDLSVSGLSHSQTKQTPNSLPSLSLPLPGGIANGSLSESNPNRVNSGNEAINSLADNISKDTKKRAKRQRVLLDAAQSVTTERKGKLQMRSLAAYRGKGNLLKVAFPAMRAGLGREDMPQITSKHKKDFIEGLKVDGVHVAVEHIAASKLRPTQAEIDAGMVNENVDKGEFESLNANPILVTKDGYIADGHHRWGIFAVAEARGKQVDMRVLRVDLPLSELMLAMEAYGQEMGVERRGIKDHKYTQHTPLKARKATDKNQTSLFDMLGGDVQPAKDYARSTPAKARKSKKAFKKQVAKEVPAIASNDAALGELFAFAEENTLSKPTGARNVSKEGNKNEPIQSNDQSNGAGSTGQVSTDAQGGTRGNRGASEGGSGRNGEFQFESGQSGSDGSDTSGGRDVSGSASNVEGAEQGGTQASGDTTGNVGVAGPRGRSSLRPRYDASKLAPQDRDHVIDASQPLAPAGNKAKFTGNVRAIELLRQLESENRNATPSEKSELAAYTGWGWAGEYFNKDNPRHAKEFAQLTELLSASEFTSAAASTTNAHFTAPEVIQGIWDAVEHLGFRGGNIVEPAGGIGHFFGLMPKNLRNRSDLNGVELDELSARIFTKLYPNASIKQQGFEESKIPNNSVDLAISNVPFGNYTLSDPNPDYRKLLIHDYFFARSLDKVKPGGLVAFVTSDGTMQKFSPKVRALLAEKADLVGAVRLPNTAFAANAGTEVTTDIIFLRKKDGSKFEGQPWQRLTEIGEGSYQENGKTVIAPIYVNEYFAKNPSMALGKHALAGSMYSAGDYAMIEDGNPMPLQQRIGNAISTLPANVISEAKQDVDLSAPTGIKANEGEVDGETRFDDDSGEFYQVVDGRRVEPLWYNRQNFGNKAAVVREIDAKKRGERKMIARDWLKVHQSIKALLTAEITEGSSDAQLTAMRAQLNRAYDLYTRKWGSLSKQHRHLEKAAFLEEHPDYALLQSVEIEKTRTVDRSLSKAERERGETGKKQKIEYRYLKGDIFRERIREPLKAPESADSATDAIAISRSLKGGIDPAYIAKLLGTTEEDAMRQAQQEQRAFQDPQTGLWEISESYLSGNVRRKLATAKQEVANGNEDYQSNVDALASIIPTDVPVHKISAQLSSRWLDSEILQAFIKDRLQSASKLVYSPGANGYSLDLDNSDTAQPEFGSDRVNVEAILLHALDGTEPVVYDSIKTASGTSRIKNKKATATAVNRVAKINKAFRTWMKTADMSVEQGKDESIPMLEYIENRYNEINNAVVEPTYSGSYLTLPGATKTVYKLPHRMSVVARILSEGSTMMAHGVGSGKTYSIIVSSYEMKRLGMAKKPLIVVQNATIGQFAASYRQAYPDARVLVATERDLTKQFRQRFLNRISTGNWDSVIITQSQFNRIESKASTVKAYYDSQLADLEEEIRHQKEVEGKRGPTTKQLEAMKKRLETKLKNKMADIKEKTDEGVMAFEDMGVDALFIDEAHEYKKVPIITRKKNVKGIPADESQRAINLELKVRHIQQQTGGRNIILATGTPITNSMAEAYVMLRLATPKVLLDYNINTFDDFANTFGETQTKLEFTWKGTWANVTRFNKFVNLPELTAMIRSGFDVKIGNKELGLKVPEMEGGGAQLEIVPQNEVTGKINDWILSIADTYENLSNEAKKDSSWVPIVTMQAGMAGSLDPRLIDPTLPDHPDSKVNTAVRNVLDIYNDDSVGVENKTQMIFADQFAPVNTEKLTNFAGGIQNDIELDDDIEIDEAESDDDNGEAKESEESKAEGEAYKKATGFNLYKDIRAKLIAGGVPANEIVIIHEANTDKRRKDLFDKMNAGTVRILLGSTAKMGVGVNAHEKLYAAHHLDPPRQMTPAMMEQRDGRIIRQGNTNKSVRNIRYGVEKSMDTGIYQLLENKGMFIHDALMGRADQRTSGDEAGEALMSMSEMKARLTGDLRIIRKAELDANLAELDLERSGHEDEMSANVRTKSRARGEIERLENRAIPAREKIVQWFDKNVPDGKLEVRIEDGPVRTERKEILEALQQRVVRLQQSVDDKSGVSGQDEREMIRFFWNDVPVELRIQSKEPETGARFNQILVKKPFELSPDNDQGFAGLNEIYSTGFKSASSAFTILGSVRKSMTTEQQIDPLKAEIDKKRAKIAPLEKAIATPWERQSEYDAAQAEVEKLNAELEMGSQPKVARPVSMEAGGLFKQPMMALHSRAATVDENQDTFDFTAAPEQDTPAPMPKINRADLVTDNMGLPTYIAARFTVYNQGHDDLIQEARLGLLKAAKGFDPRVGEFAPYAARIIRNHLISVYRKEPQVSRVPMDAPKAEGEFQTQDVMADTDAASPLKNTEQRETRAALRGVIAGLPKLPREIVQRAMQGQSFAKIGKALNLSKQAVQQRHARALQLMRKRLTEQGAVGQEDGVLRSARADGQKASTQVTLSDVDAKPIADYAQRIPASDLYTEGDDYGVETESHVTALYGLLSDADSPVRKVVEGFGPITLTLGRTSLFENDKYDVLKLDIESDDLRQLNTLLRASQTHESDFPEYVPHMTLAYLKKGEGKKYAGDGNLMGKSITFDSLTLSGFGDANGVHSKVEIDLGGKPTNPDGGGKQIASRAAESINTQPSTDALQQMAYLEDWAVRHGETLDELIADTTGFDEATAKWRAAHPSGQPLPQKVASRMAGSDDQAVKSLIDMLNESVPDRSQAGVDAASAETPGEKTQGRPDLANPAESAEARSFVDSVDEARKEKSERQTHIEWEAKARAMLEHDKQGVKRRLLEVAQDPRYNGLTDAVDVKAAQILVAESVQNAVESGNADEMREAQILTFAYRESGSETARAMAARRDPHKTPAERHKEFLASVFFRPDRKTAKLIKNAPSATEKSRDMDRIKAQLKAAEKSGNASKAELVRLRRELIELKNQPSKTELLTGASAARLKRIEAALDTLGVTLEDIFSGETEIHLKADNIVGNYAGHLDAKRKQASEMLHRGLAASEIKKATGLSQGDVNDLVDDFQREYIAKHKAKYLAALKGRKVNANNAEDTEVITLLKSAPGDLSDAQLEKMAMEAMQRDMAKMGFGKGNKSKSNQAERRKRKGIGRRKVKTSKARTQSVPGVVYEWEINNPKDGTKHHQKATARDLNEGLEPVEFDISNPVDVARVARITESVDGGAFDMAYEFWINSILSGPQTHVANITGNTLNTVLDMTLQRGMEATINKALGLIGKSDPDAAQFGEFKHLARGIMPGIMDGWAAAIEAWGSETSLFENRVLDKQINLGGVGKLENYKTSIPGRTGRVVRVPGRALLFMDEFFKGVIARAQVGAEAYRMAKGEGLKGEAMEKRITGLVNLVGSDAWVKASDRATELTFQSDFEEGSAMRGISDFISKGKQTLPIMRFIIPFVRTILNIFNVGIRKSPVGSLNLIYRVAAGQIYKLDGVGGIKGKKYPRPEFIKHAAEQVLAMGAAAMLSGAMEGDDDDDEKTFLITGARSFTNTKYGVSELHNRAGTPAYTIKLGNFTFQYGRYEPISTVLGVTTNLVREAKRSNTSGEDGMLGAIAGSMVDQVMSKTFASGISDLVEAIHDERKFSRYIANFASSWVPNILRQPLRLADPIHRNASTESDSMAGSMFERTTESILPFLKAEKIDIWGQPMVKGGNVISRLLVPQKAETTAPLNRPDKLLVSWNQSHPDDTYAPTPPRRNIRLGDDNYHMMTDEEFVQYQVTRGQTALKLINRVPLNIANPTETDLDKIRKALSSGHKRAKAELLRSLR